MSGFQTQVNIYPAPGVEGDFASNNPRASAVTSEAGFVAGTEGVTIGRFCWLDHEDSVTVYSHGMATEKPIGFVHREQQALITQYLGESSMQVPTGYPVTAFSRGDFWAKVTGSTAATVGATVYATYATGEITVGSAATSATCTAAMGATTTATLGASIVSCTGAADILTVGSLTGTGSYISVGDVLVGTGIPEDTVVLEQLTGTPGGAGTYQTSKATTISAASATSYGNVVNITAVTGYVSVGETISGITGVPVGTTITAQISGTAGSTGLYQLSASGTAYAASGSGKTTYGNILHVTAVSTGTLKVGDPVSGDGSNIPSGAVISALGTNTSGGVGFYTLSSSATAYAASQTVTAVGGVLTDFVCMTPAAVGELTKISSWR